MKKTGFETVRKKCQKSCVVVGLPLPTHLGFTTDELEIMVLMRMKLSFHGCFLFLLSCTYVQRVCCLLGKQKEDMRRSGGGRKIGKRDTRRSGDKNEGR